MASFIAQEISRKVTPYPMPYFLGEEVLSRSLNTLHYHPDYYGFCMEKRRPQVNHLIFADYNTLHFKIVQNYEAFNKNPK